MTAFPQEIRHRYDTVPKALTSTVKQEREVKELETKK
jgi:hypothetical protein